MPRATFDDAILIARILEMNVETVWPVIRGMHYAYYADLKVAVLNSPVRRELHRAETGELGAVDFGE